MSNQPPFDPQGQPGSQNNPQGQPDGYPPAPQQGQPGGYPQQGAHPAAPQGQPAGYPAAPQGQPGGYPSAPQGGGPQGPGGYQAAPQVPGGFNQQPANITKPKSIDMAVKLMYVGAGLALLNILLTFALKGQIKDKLEEQLVKDGKSLDDLDAAVNTGLVGGAIVGLLSVGLWIWMAKSNEAGKSWARIVSTVLGGLSILGFFGSLATGQTVALTLILGIISLILAAAILFFLWQKDSSEYFAAKSAPKQMY